MTDETAVVKKENTAVALPDYIENEQKGAESLGAKDVIIPRLKLVQGLSDEHVDSGIAEGNFVNAITKENYGTKINMAVILATKGLIMFEKGKKGKDAKIISRSFAGNMIPPLKPELVLDPKNQQWTEEIIKDDDGVVTGKKPVPPRAITVYQYIVLVNGRDMLSFSLMKTGVKAAKQLNTLLKMKNIPTYSQNFTVESVLTKSDAGPYYGVKIDPAGYVAKELYIALAMKYEAMATSNIVTDFEDEPEKPVAKSTTESDI